MPLLAGLVIAAPDTGTQLQSIVFEVCPCTGAMDFKPFGNNRRGVVGLGDFFFRHDQQVTGNDVQRFAACTATALDVDMTEQPDDIGILVGLAAIRDDVPGVAV